ncbi:MAG TPA: histidine kinase [Wenzhouxiangella sp.]|nr:histidine kinase [Wenzhouxiangella sp.]
MNKSDNPLRPRGRDRFWVSQVIIWTFYAIASSLGRLTYTHHEYDGPDTSIIVLSATLGFVISSGLGYLYQKLSLGQAARILVVVLLASVASAFIWTFSNNLIYSLLDPVRWQDAHFSFYLVGILNSGFILLSWSAGYFSFKYYKQSQDQRQEMSDLKIQAQQAKLQMLRYQLNPHFLFNTLASISALIRDGRNDVADQMLGRMSELLRLTLKSSPIDMVTVRDELGMLDMYIEIEKARFEERLQYRCLADDDSLPVLVPSLILQPLVENSIKHAIACSPNGGSVALSVRVRDERLRVTLTDSGAAGGRSSNQKGADGTKLGLKNVRRRLRNIYKDDHRFEVIDGDTGGVTIEMDLPAYAPA